MSGDFLFRRSADELQAAFDAAVCDDQIKFCGVVLNEVTVEDLGKLDAEVSAAAAGGYQSSDGSAAAAGAAAYPSPLSCKLQRSELFMALSCFFSQEQYVGSSKLLFARFARSLLKSATSVLKYAEENYKNNQKEFTDYFIPHEPTEVECSISWVRGVLANAFLGNVIRDPVQSRKDGFNAGGLNLTAFFNRRDPVTRGKISCLVQYFVASDPEICGVARSPHNDYDNYMDLANPKQRKVVFQKLHMTDTDFQKLLVKGCTSSRSVVDIHDDVMEKGDADAFVNFANPNYGYGKFITSCTQEEILQMCCPEMNVGMLFYGKMDGSNVVLTHNARRFSTYSGYLDTFTFEGPVDPGTYRDQTLIAMDAVLRGHYTDESNLRDTKKAYLGWKGTLDWLRKSKPTPGDNRIVRITTGRWGCGAFGGLVPHKYIQQIIALELANGGGQEEDSAVQLLFACFKDPETKAILERLQASLTGISPCDMFNEVVLGGDASKYMTRNINGLIARANKVRTDAGLRDNNERGDGGVDRSNTCPRDIEDIERGDDGVDRSNARPRDIEDIDF